MIFETFFYIFFITIFAHIIDIFAEHHMGQISVQEVQELMSIAEDMEKVESCPRKMFFLSIRYRD